MPNHFSDIGFRITKDNLETAIGKIYNGTRKDSFNVEASNHAEYIMLNIDEQIEIWFPVKNNKISPFSFTLFYRTNTFLEIENAERIKDNYSMYDAALPDYYPLRIMCPTPKLYPYLSKYKKYKCQVACFADQMKVYKNADEFYEDSPYGEKFGVNMLVPSGTFGPDEETGKINSRIIMSGTVKSFEERTNSFTGRCYDFIRVETYGGEYDILADPEFIPDDISEGDIIFGLFTLYGKIMPLFHGDEFSGLKCELEDEPHPETLGDLYHILRKSWSAQTAYPTCQEDWSETDRTYGQCAVTAMVVNHMFGGTMHKIKLIDGTHYFNKIKGKYVDLSSEHYNLYGMIPYYEQNEEVDRAYCESNPDTMKRYELLMKNISDNLKENN